MGYEDVLFDDIFSRNKGSDGVLYIFDNFFSLNRARKNYQDYFSIENNLFLTKSEFRDEIFAKSGSILSGNQRVLELFLSMSNESKRHFNVNNFFDALEFAKRFFGYYEELFEERVVNIKGLFDWQWEMVNKLKVVHDDYRVHLERNGKLDKIFLSNFELKFSGEYKKIVFVDILYFSARDKEVVDYFSNFIDVELYLQMPESYFDKRNLKLKKAHVSVERKNRIKIIYSSDYFLQSINVMKEAKRGSKVIDLEKINRPTSYLEFSSMFSLNKELRVEQSKVFGYLKNFFKLSNTMTSKNEGKRIKLSDLFSIRYSPYFSNKFNISENEKEHFDYLVSEGFKYLTEDGIVFKELFELLREANEIEEINHFCSFIEEISSSVLSDEGEMEEGYTEIVFEALQEMKSMNENSLKGEWGKVTKGNFGSTFASLLFFLLNRLSKGVVIKQKDGEIKVDQLSKSPPEQNENLSIMNLNGDAEGGNRKLKGYILMDFQRRYNGLKDSVVQDLEYKYSILRHIMSAKNVTLFYVKNSEKNIESNSLIEELKIKWNIREQEGAITERDYPQVLSQNLVGEEFRPFPFSKDDELPFRQEDIVKEGEVAMGFYEFGDFSRCKYKYYLRHVAKVNERDVNSIIERIDPTLLGNIVHDILNKVAEEMEGRLKKGVFEVPDAMINNIIEPIVAKEKDRISLNYSKYYEKVLYPFLSKGVKTFYGELKKVLKGERVDRLLIEDSAKLTVGKYEGINFVIKGKADLRVESPNSKRIVDYKTGFSEPKQLDFYNIIYYNNQRNIYKFFYKFFDEELKEEVKDGLSGDTIVNELGSFIKDTIYPRTKNKSICKYCEYVEICRAKGK